MTRAAPRSRPTTSVRSSRTAVPRAAVTRPAGARPAVPPPPAPRQAVGAAASDDQEPLATATYITGSSTLEPGRRYGFRIDDDRLIFLGPMDLAPSAIALQLDISGVDATSVAGRVLISQPAARSGPVLAFMSIVGLTPDGLVEAIIKAARAPGRA